MSEAKIAKLRQHKVGINVEEPTVALELNNDDNDSALILGNVDYTLTQEQYNELMLILDPFYEPTEDLSGRDMQINSGDTLVDDNGFTLITS